MSRSSPLAFQKSPRYETLGPIEEEKTSRRCPLSDGVELSVGSRWDKQSESVLPVDSVAIKEMRSQNEELRQKCDSLEQLMAKLRNDGNIFKMKTSLTLSTYKSKIGTMTNDKEALSEQCAILQAQLAEIREQNLSRQLEIFALESSIIKENREDDGSLNTQGSQETHTGTEIARHA